jgi:hypothetical protein
MLFTAARYKQPCSARCDLDIRQQQCDVYCGSLVAADPLATEERMKVAVAVAVDISGGLSPMRLARYGQNLSRSSMMGAAGTEVCAPAVSTRRLRRCDASLQASLKGHPGCARHAGSLAPAIAPSRRHPRPRPRSRTTSRRRFSTLMPPRMSATCIRWSSRISSSGGRCSRASRLSC